MHTYVHACPVHLFTMATIIISTVNYRMRFLFLFMVTQLSYRTISRRQRHSVCQGTCAYIMYNVYTLI